MSIKSNLNKTNKSDLFNKFKELESEVKILRANCDRYKLILEGSNDGIWDWDAERDIYSVSIKDKDCVDCNFNGQNFSIKLWKSMIHPEDRDNAICALDQFISEGKKSYENVYRLKTKTGIDMWILSKGIAQHDENGKIIRIAGSHTDITPTVEMEKRLHNLAYYDNLTELANKEKIKNEFNNLIKEKFEDGNMAFLYIDIDDLSYINNTLGYSAGDELIKKVALFLVEKYGEKHYIARMNADEFLVMYVNYENLEVLEAELQELFLEIKNEKFLGGNEINVSISMGISIYNLHSKDFYDLLRYSDTALYCSKKGGKDQYKIYEPEMGEYVYTTIDLINQIRIGLQKQEFQMHYQPIVNAKTGLLVGMEALVRWIHPRRGFVPPTEFISIAEGSGQIMALERWIIEDVFSQISRWIEIGEMPIFISINLSAKGLIEKDLIPYLKDLIKRYNSKPDKIEFEVTETALLNNLEHSLSVLYQLKELGFKVSLDDFGTGYSSLNYLKSLPIDKVKLDRSFVENIDKNNKDQLLVKSIIELSHGMELEVVGEGVETISQNELLGTFGCDYIQGYYHGRPQSVNNINCWIGENCTKGQYKIAGTTSN